MSRLADQKRQGGDQMAKVRKQVSTLLVAAQQGETLDLAKFLDDFAREALEEERGAARLDAGDDSDADDNPEGHFAQSGHARADGSKPSKQERLEVTHTRPRHTIPPIPHLQKCDCCPVFF